MRGTPGRGMWDGRRWGEYIRPAPGVTRTAGGRQSTIPSYARPPPQALAGGKGPPGTGDRGHHRPPLLPRPAHEPGAVAAAAAALLARTVRGALPARPGVRGPVLAPPHVRTGPAAAVPRRPAGLLHRPHGQVPAG